MPPLRKCLVIILDGLGDRASPVLGGATPLEAAATPNLDALAEGGVCGLVDPLYPGMPVGTHTGTGVHFGLAFRDALRLTRGPVEAAGIGLPIQPGDVAVRCNFATVEPKSDGLSLIDRRAGRIREGTDVLAEVLQNVSVGHGITATLQPATQHRAVLRLTGPEVSAAVTDTDPGAGEEGAGVLQCYPRKPDDPGASKTADALNQFIREAHARLRDHPVNRHRQAQGMLLANGIITRGAGRIRRLHSLIHHLGLSAAVVAGERTVLGLGQLLHYTTITEPGFTSMPDTNLTGKIAATLSAVKEHDLVFLHIKGTDIYSHDRKPEQKRTLIERIDRVLPPLMQEDLVIGVTGDHSTDSNTGRHCGDPVPSLLYSPSGRRDGCRKFGEIHCASGGLGRISATSFLLSVLDYRGSLHNFQPSDRMFFSSEAG
ncbi:MAG: alkaline phosphatase family protein [Gammaproteobacteria bacterium]|nr:alkaline phosphatase family protein [Gammaproteobacteria bacterium]